ncbi:hypothetical protein D9M68_537900 [compost metagenome]
MLARPRILRHLRNPRGGQIAGIDPAYATPFVMHLQHDPRCFFVILIEELLQYFHDELHRGVVVIEQQDLIHRRRSGASRCLLDGQIVLGIQGRTHRAAILFKLGTASM